MSKILNQKLKNTEGVDRIPQRLLNDGKEMLLDDKPAYENLQSKTIATSMENVKNYTNLQKRS